MDFKIISVQRLSDSQVGELAKLHESVIHSLLSELGSAFLQKYYRIVREDGTAIGFCAVSENDRVIGWATGSSAPDHITRHLQEPFLWFVLQMLRVLFTRPSLIWQTFLSARQASNEMEPGQIELTYIGVAPSARRRGLGEALVTSFLKASAGRYRSVVLSVEVENESAIRLYTKLGFKIVDTFMEGTFRRHRMEVYI